MGNSYFEDLPIPSENEPYDVATIKQEIAQFLGQNYPNQRLLGMLPFIQGTQLIEQINPARKKRVRFEALCEHLRKYVPDVVFLQEIWYQKDYDFLQNCLDGSGFYFSKFDPTCGFNPVSF